MSDKDKENLYSELRAIMDTALKGERLIILADFNAGVGGDWSVCAGALNIVSASGSVTSIPTLHRKTCILLALTYIPVQKERNPRIKSKPLITSI